MTFHFSHALFQFFSYHKNRSAGYLLPFFPVTECINIAIDKLIHHIGKHRSTHNIQHGMLFQKHGGQTDCNHDDKRKDANPSVVFQAFTVHDADMYAQGIVYMDARKHVGRGVAVMDHLYQIAENIFMRIHFHPQICPIWINGADEHTDRHTDKQKSTESVIILLIREEEIKDCTGNINKPDHIRNDKIFRKRDHVIQRHMHDLIMICDHTFQPEEIWQIQKDISADPDMSIFF